jgi:ubiquinol-cytochrome c reductase iron-sulfur subunit
LLGAALVGIGAGLVWWGKILGRGGPVLDHRDPLVSSRTDRVAAEESLRRGEEALGRRPVLLTLLAGAAGSLGLAVLFPIRSLGPSPGRSLFSTSWRTGVRLVTNEGRPVRAGDLLLDGVLTVFPEGNTADADAQAVLIHVDPAQLHTGNGRETWAPGGLVAYSKICTHAGCPVGLYRTSTHELFCPCHQSTFAVLEGARPVFGPAARPLPQLPIAVDADGFLVAQSDFHEPVGPGFWNRG